MMTAIEKQNAKSMEIMQNGLAWFECLAEIHKDHIARKMLFQELAKCFRHYGDKLDKELKRIETLN